MALLTIPAALSPVLPITHLLFGVRTFAIGLPERASYLRAAKPTSFIGLRLVRALMPINTLDPSVRSNVKNELHTR